MNLIITIISVLVFSYLITLLGKKIKIPEVVALIISGLIIGSTSIKNIIIEPNTQFIFGLGDIALLCLMFIAGLESSWRELYNEKRDALFIAVFAAVIPFLIGFIIFTMLGFSILISFIVGICMSITAEATKARVLLELKKLRTRVGSAIMSAGIIDDVIGLSLFILITYLFKETYIKEDLLIGGAIAAFFIGVLIQKEVGRQKIKHFEKVLLWFVVPFFFISTGILFDLNSLIVNPYLLLLIITIALTGKLFGTTLIKPFTNFSWKQIYLIGWAMNSRGAIELALALIAFKSRLIPIELYSSLVVMALVTTLIFPFIVTRMIKKEPEIMN